MVTLGQVLTKFLIYTPPSNQILVGMPLEHESVWSLVLEIFVQGVWCLSVELSDDTLVLGWCPFFDRLIG